MRSSRSLLGLADCVCGDATPAAGHDWSGSGKARERLKRIIAVQLLGLCRNCSDQTPELPIMHHGHEARMH